MKKTLKNAAINLVAWTAGTLVCMASILAYLLAAKFFGLL